MKLCILFHIGKVMCHPAKLGVFTEIENTFNLESMAFFPPYCRSALKDRCVFKLHHIKKIHVFYLVNSEGTSYHGSVSL